MAVFVHTPAVLAESDTDIVVLVERGTSARPATVACPAIAAVYRSTADSDTQGTADLNTPDIVGLIVVASDFPLAKVVVPLFGFSAEIVLVVAAVLAEAAAAAAAVLFVAVLVERTCLLLFLLDDRPGALSVGCDELVKPYGEVGKLAVSGKMYSRH